MSRAEVYALIDESVTCAVRTYGPDVSATYHAGGTIAAECLGGDTLSLTITSSLGKTVVMLDSDELARLRAQIDEVLRGPDIAELESLAAGPRTTVDDTAGLARPFAAETLAHGWDADGREVR